MVNEGLVPNSERLFDLLSCIANHSQLYKVSSSIDKLICNSEILNPEIYNMLINGFWKESNKLAEGLGTYLYNLKCTSIQVHSRKY
jgi:hypothetical protein